MTILENRSASPSNCESINNLHAARIYLLENNKNWQDKNEHSGIFYFNLSVFRSKNTRSKSNDNKSPGRNRTHKIYTSTYRHSHLMISRQILHLATPNTEVNSQSLPVAINELKMGKSISNFNLRPKLAYIVTTFERF